ncbi:MAG: hypothetical protein M5U15_06295 [Kiritimatiellae bacterium]|nr:hypothetical protein [Kiritimatiellia bacterium]
MPVQRRAAQRDEGAAGDGTHLADGLFSRAVLKAAAPFQRKDVAGAQAHDRDFRLAFQETGGVHYLHILADGKRQYAF